MTKNSPQGGILLIDKPLEVSSFWVISQLRKKTGFKKIGHAGTLDPLATGLLVVGVESGTKILEYLQLDTKVYEVGFRLGQTSNTDDLAGELSELLSVGQLSSEDVLSKLKTFVGEIDQVPPQFSAIKVNGKRAYALARKGEEVNLVSRKVHIQAIDHFSYSAGDGTFTVTCSKGTYVRSLVRDLGKVLGVGALVTSIRRVASGHFDVTQAISPEALSQASSISEFKFFSASEALPHFSVLSIPEELWEKKVQFGNALNPFDLESSTWLRRASANQVILSIEGNCDCAIAECDLNEVICVKKRF